METVLNPPNIHEEQEVHITWMISLAMAIGIVAGGTSILFRGLIALCHNVLFNGQFSFAFNTAAHAAPSIWGMGIIFAPVLGAIIVTWLTRNFAPEATGGGIPEVMYAIYHNKGRIRPIVAIIKALASAISIGSGGSVGREGPIVHIGAAISATFSRFIKMPSRQRIILIAAGTAAGIAATFNAPIGGLAFAVELMLVSISAVSVTLVAIATVTATIVGRYVLGFAPTFNVPSIIFTYHHSIHFTILLLMIPFGILLGLLASLFIRAIYWAEDRFAAINNVYLRHMLGMLILGILIYAFLHFTGHYYIEGIGYATIIDILRNTLTNPWFILLLLSAKLLATCLTLGSGASGGYFSPTLYLGATFGAAFAYLLHFIEPSITANPIPFAIAGMAAMVSGSTGAIITAITMTVEQTHGYNMILPIMLTSSIAYVVRIKLMPESIYTLKLFRRGKSIPQGLQAAIAPNLRAKNIMEANFQVVSINELANWINSHDPDKTSVYTVVVEDGEIAGMIHEELRYLMIDIDPHKLLHQSFAFIHSNTSWANILRKMQRHDIDLLLVANTNDASAKHLLGIITKKEIIATAKQTAELLL